MSEYSDRFKPAGSSVSRQSQKQLVPYRPKSSAPTSDAASSRVSSRQPASTYDRILSRYDQPGTEAYVKGRPPPGCAPHDYFEKYSKTREVFDAVHGRSATRKVIRRQSDQPTFQPSTSDVAPGIAQTVVGPGSEAWTAVSASSSTRKHKPPVQVNFDEGEEHPMGEVTEWDSVSQAPSRPPPPWPTSTSPTSQLGQYRTPGRSVASGATTASTRISTTSTQIHRMVQEAIEADRRGRRK